MLGINRKIEIKSNELTEIWKDSFHLFKNSTDIFFENDDFLVLLDGSMVEPTLTEFIEEFGKYGIEAVEGINGAFLLCIIDKKEGELYLVTDPFGTKPIFYSEKGDSFVFSSKIQDLLSEKLVEKDLNDSLLGLSLSLQYTPGAETYFKGVYLLEPGHFLRYSIRDHKLYKNQYYKYHFHPTNEPDEVLEEELFELLKKAIELRKEDGKIGAFLSSGIDSSFITKLLNPDKTFTAAFDHNEGIFDEASHAVELSRILDIPCEIVEINGKMVYENLPEIQKAFDSPFGNLSALPLFFLDKRAQKEVDQVFTGEGADEFFGGYDSYLTSNKGELLERIPKILRKPLIGGSSLFSKSFSKRLENHFLPVEETFIGETKIFEEEELQKLLKSPYKNHQKIEKWLEPIYTRFRQGTDLQKKMMVNMEVFMVYDILRKADRMNRHFNIRAEMPFYDKEIVEFSKKLTDEQKVRHTTSKVLLRKTATDHLPEEWIKNRKLGFPVPLRYWITEDYFYSGIYKAFSSKTAEKFFNRKYIISLLENHKEGKALNHRKIYNIYAFLIWYDEYFIKSF